MAELGARLRLARERAGIPLMRAAQLSGQRPSTLTRWEQGAGEPGVIAAVRLAQLYGVDPEWLVSGDGQPD